MNLQHKTILVIGLGKTGTAVCEFVLRRGATVIGVDDLPPEMLGPKMALLADRGVMVYSSEDSHLINWSRIDLAIVSPGVSLKNPLVCKTLEGKIPLRGEIEFASKFSQAPVIAITGTNGKSTTTELVGALLKQQGLRVSVGGNLGTPWVSLIDQDPSPDWTVLELSSYQLETTETFHPSIAVILNITDDHFERHENLQGYALAKGRIFLNQTLEDFLVYSADDIHVQALALQAPSKKIPFSLNKKVEGIYWDTQKSIRSFVGGQERVYSLTDLPLQGLHNIENMAAAIAVAEIVKVAPNHIQEGLKRFGPLSHRLEFVRELKGVRYFDDSKGTNVGAVAMSLAGFEDPVILILGGRDKGGDYRVLHGLVRHKVKALILMGEAKEKIRKALGDGVFTCEVETMQEAVKEAQGLSAPGDVVLLSPACSSFDMFRDYKHRGDEFQKWVKTLEG